MLYKSLGHRSVVVVDITRPDAASHIAGAVPCPARETVVDDTAVRVFGGVFGVTVNRPSTAVNQVVFDSEIDVVSPFVAELHYRTDPALVAELEGVVAQRDITASGCLYAVIMRSVTYRQLGDIAVLDKHVSVCLESISTTSYKNPPGGIVIKAKSGRDVRGSPDYLGVFYEQPAVDAAVIGYWVVISRGNPHSPDRDVVCLNYDLSVDIQVLDNHAVGIGINTTAIGQRRSCGYAGVGRIGVASEAGVIYEVRNKCTGRYGIHRSLQPSCRGAHGLFYTMSPCIVRICSVSHKILNLLKGNGQCNLTDT